MKLREGAEYSTTSKLFLESPLQQRVTDIIQLLGKPSEAVPDNLRWSKRTLAILVRVAWFATRRGSGNLLKTLQKSSGCTLGFSMKTSRSLLPNSARKPVLE